MPSVLALHPWDEGTRAGADFQNSSQVLSPSLGRMSWSILGRSRVELPWEGLMRSLLLCLVNVGICSKASLGSPCPAEPCRAPESAWICGGLAAASTVSLH